MIVLLDVNGTLFRDMPNWYAGVQKIFNFFGKNPPTIEEYFRELKGDYLNIYRSRGISASREELNEIYEKSYQEGLDKISLFPGVKTTLKALIQRYVKIGLVSTQKEYLVIPILYRFKIQKLFDWLEFDVIEKANVINSIIKKMEINPSECFFVGDTPSDITNANKVGATSIAFINNSIPGDLIASANPRFIIRAHREILKIVESFPEKRVV